MVGGEFFIQMENCLSGFLGELLGITEQFSAARLCGTRMNLVYVADQKEFLADVIVMAERAIANHECVPDAVCQFCDKKRLLVVEVARRIAVTDDSARESNETKEKKI